MVQCATQAQNSIEDKITVTPLYFVNGKVTNM